MDENFEVVSPVFTVPSGANKATVISVTNGGQIVYDFGNQKVGFKTIEGEFMEVGKFFERVNEFEIVLNADELKNILSGYKQSNVVLGFTTKNESVLIRELGYSDNRRMILPIKKEED